MKRDACLLVILALCTSNTLHCTEWLRKAFQSRLQKNSPISASASQTHTILVAPSQTPAGVEHAPASNPQKSPAFPVVAQDQSKTGSRSISVVAASPAQQSSPALLSLIVTPPTKPQSPQHNPPPLSLAAAPDPSPSPVEIREDSLAASFAAINLNPYDRKEPRDTDTIYWNPRSHRRATGSVSQSAIRPMEIPTNNEIYMVTPAIHTFRELAHQAEAEPPGGNLATHLASALPNLTTMLRRAPIEKDVLVQVYLTEVNHSFVSPCPALSLGTLSFIPLAVAQHGREGHHIEIIRMGNVPVKYRCRQLHKADGWRESCTTSWEEMLGQQMDLRRPKPVPQLACRTDTVASAATLHAWQQTKGAGKVADTVERKN